MADVSLEEPELVDVYAADRTTVYLRGLWNRREYVVFVALSELRNRQMTTLLGNLWHLLNPALSIAVYWLIFGVVLGVDRGVENYTLFITVGILVFADIQRAAMAGAGSIANNRGLLQSLAFPRALLPVTSTMTETLATLPSFAVIVFVAFVSGESFRFGWFLLPVLLAAVFIMNLGVALIVARVSSRFTDVRQILPFVFRLLLYGSGIIFSVDAYAAGKSWGWLFSVNPVYCYVSIARWLVSGGDLQGEWFVSAGSWTIGLLVIGFSWFRAVEDTYGRS